MFVVKIFKFAAGLILLCLYHRKLNLKEVLKGKRVALIGPADSAFHTGRGSYIDGFDVVVRINKAPLLLKTEKWEKDIGKKADILFHSFYENELSGGGPIDIDLYKSLGIRYLINPVASYEGYRVTLNFYKKYLRAERVYSLSRKEYRKILNVLDGVKPTIGFCALYSILESDFDELYISGFTFFKTGFGDGYRDHIKETAKARDYLANAKLHNPDREYAAFLRLKESHSGKRIILDDSLQHIILSNQP